MFLKRTKVRSGKNVYTYLQRVESVWRDRSPALKVVANLGWEDQLEPAQIGRLLASLAQYGTGGGAATGIRYASQGQGIC